jgi:hypothetical protein
MMQNFKNTDKVSTFAKLVNKEGKNIFKVGQEGGSSFSTFSEEETATFTRVVNSVLANDKHLQKALPINPEGMDLYLSLKDGIILCKLINLVEHKIDERVINIKDNLNIFQMTENLNLAINTAKVIGCTVIGINSTTIIEQKYTLILGLLWQIIKQVLMKDINLKSHPQLIRLLKEGETFGDLLKLPKEDLLLRWFNFHLTAAGHPDHITNFSGDIKDSVKYTVLLNQLNKVKCDKSALDETDTTKRAQKMLDSSKKLGVESYITSKDVVNGNNKLNIIFTAAIFNHCHGLDPPTEQEAYETAKLLNDDVEGSREERAFRNWMNCLGIDDLYVNNMYEDVKDGTILLRVFDKIQPGCVDWKKVDKAPNNKFKKIVNCNECIDAAKKCGFSIVGIGGTDVHDGNKKLILAVVWQMMKHHTLKVLGNKTENDLLAWANDLANRDPKAGSFKDKSLRNSLFFIHLMNAIEPRAINWEIVVQDKEDDESLENNAKYAISVARRLGASIFLVWEDIKDVSIIFNVG